MLSRINSPWGSALQSPCLGVLAVPSTWVDVTEQESSNKSQIAYCCLGHPINSSFKSRCEPESKIFAWKQNLCLFLINNNSGSYIPEERHFQKEMRKKKKELSKNTVPISTNQREHKDTYRCRNYWRLGNWDARLCSGIDIGTSRIILRSF